MWRNYETNLRMIQNVLLSSDSLFAVLMLCLSPTTGLLGKPLQLVQEVSQGAEAFPGAF